MRDCGVDRVLGEVDELLSVLRCEESGQLALGQSLPTAVRLAKAYVLAAIRNSYAIGRGPGPVNHMHRIDGSLKKE